MMAKDEGECALRKRLPMVLLGQKVAKWVSRYFFEKQLLEKNYNLTNQLEIKSGLKVSRSLKHILNFQVRS
jgi:hypothetical protein